MILFSGVYPQPDTFELPSRAGLVQEHVGSEIPIDPRPVGKESGQNEEQPQSSLWGPILLLIEIIVLFVFVAERLVDSIDGFSRTAAIPKQFTAMYLLPIVASAAQHLSAFTLSTTGEFCLSMDAVIRSSFVSHCLLFRAT